VADGHSFPAEQCATVSVDSLEKTETRARAVVSTSNGRHAEGICVGLRAVEPPLDRRGPRRKLMAMARAPATVTLEESAEDAVYVLVQTRETLGPYKCSTGSGSRSST
jgi:hypothetical protein